jgi:hypothetical protein
MFGGVFAGPGTTCGNWPPDPEHPELYVPNPCLCPGDLNCDGVVDFGDIDPFVEALSYPGGENWPFDCPWLTADCNRDGDVTFDDIDPFVALIGTPCP